MSTNVGCNRSADLSGTLKLAVLFVVPVAIFAGFLLYTSTDTVAYPMRNDTLQAAVLAKLKPRLQALQVSRMEWAACRLDNPVTIESEFAASTGKYRFDSTSGDYVKCDSNGSLKILRWSFVIQREPDGSYQMRMHSIDPDVPFTTYRDAAIGSGEAALGQLEREIRSEREDAKQRAQAQASWRAPGSSQDGPR